MLEHLLFEIFILSEGGLLNIGMEGRQGEYFLSDLSQQLNATDNSILRFEHANQSINYPLIPNLSGPLYVYLLRSFGLI